MSQNLTQPEEIDQALMEMSEKGMTIDVLVNDVKQFYRADQQEVIPIGKIVNSSSEFVL